MNQAEFTKLVDSQLEECRRVLVTKGEAYAGNVDRLANFKRNAADLGLTPFQIWSVYAFKHIDTIKIAIKTNPQSPVDKSEGLDGRITDAINYLLLLKSLLHDN